MPVTSPEGVGWLHWSTWGVAGVGSSEPVLSLHAPPMSVHAPPGSIGVELPMQSFMSYAV